MKLLKPEVVAVEGETMTVPAAMAPVAAQIQVQEHWVVFLLVQTAPLNLHFFPM
jgi:hypothetical protein